jgi:hypothetical protein
MITDKEAVMERERVQAQDRITATLEARATLDEHVVVDDVFTIECYSADGTLIWREETARAVVDVDAHRIQITQS